MAADGCALSGLRSRGLALARDLRFAAAFLPLAGPPRLNTLYHLIDRDVFKFALPDNPSATANRSPHPWIRRTEQRNRWTAEIGGQVRDAGIVADISTAAAKVVEDFRKRQISEYANAIPFGSGSYQHYGVWQLIHQFLEVRPILFRAAAAGMNDDIVRIRCPQVRQRRLIEIQRSEQVIRSVAMCGKRITSNHVGYSRKP